MIKTETIPDNFLNFIVQFLNLQNSSNVYIGFLVEVLKKESKKKNKKKRKRFQKLGEGTVFNAKKSRCGWIWHSPHLCGFFKNLFSGEWLKPCFFVTFKIIMLPFSWKFYWNSLCRLEDISIFFFNIEDFH